MNYLAHLFLARKTPDSHFGNLLGDFRRGVNISAYSDDVLLGLENHYAVDKFTDAHDSVVTAKQFFHPSRRRFAPVALDIYFDHLLIKHWKKFSHIPFEQFCAKSFSLLKSKLPDMPRTMQHSIGHMITHNWFVTMPKKRVSPRLYLLWLSASALLMNFTKQQTILQGTHIPSRSNFSHFFLNLSRLSHNMGQKVRKLKTRNSLRTRYTSKISATLSSISKEFSATGYIVSSTQLTTFIRVTKNLL